MGKRNLGFALIAALSVMGCQTVKEVAVTSGAPKAKVRFVFTDATKYTASMAAFGQTCRDAGLVGVMAHANNKPDTMRIGIPDAPPPTLGVLEREVTAGTKIALFPWIMARADAADVLFAMTPVGQAGFAAKATGACRVPMTVLEPDAMYEITINAVPKTCDYRVWRLTGQDGKVTRTEVVFPDTDIVEIHSMTKIKGPPCPAKPAKAT